MSKEAGSTLPPELLQFTDPANPKEQRLMAAQGIIPVPPKQLAQILYVIIENDPDPEVRTEAEKSIADLPDSSINDILKDTGSDPGLIDFLAKNITDERKLQSILLNNITLDQTFAHIARATDSQMLIEMIANNHLRLIRSTEIVEAVSTNPAISRSTLDGIINFLNVQLHKDQDTFATESLTVESEQDVEETLDTEDYDESFLDNIEFPDELTEENDQPEIEEIEEEDNIRNANLLNQINNMTIGEKIKLSLMGNREARRLLIRDHNRVVSGAVLKNARLTDSEIVQIAGSKIVSEDILRSISETRRWVSLYQVKASLVTNPKTPQHISMNFVKQLRDIDLRGIMRNKNLPGIISTMARKVIAERKTRK